MLAEKFKNFCANVKFCCDHDDSATDFASLVSCTFNALALYLQQIHLLIVNTNHLNITVDELWVALHHNL